MMVTMPDIMNNNQILLDLCSEEGLYLIFDDSVILPLTRDKIHKASTEFWLDSDRISDKVKQAAEFQRCDLCPLNKIGGLCDAIRPTMPFLDDIDKYFSYDQVTSVYNDGRNNLTINRTTMQEALKYLSILSLMHYCRLGRTYWKYFIGITPTMTPKQIAYQLYLNFYYLNDGKPRRIKKALSTFCDQITITCRNQVKRMNLACKNDVFMNAFVNTQLITQILSLDFDKTITEQFDSARPSRLEPLRDHPQLSSSSIDS